jgi:hypothetical protein
VRQRCIDGAGPSPNLFYPLVHSRLLFGPHDIWAEGMPLKRIVGIVVLVACGSILYDLSVIYIHTPRAWGNYISLKRKLCTLTNTVVSSGRGGWLFFQPELEYMDDSLQSVNIQSIAAFNDTLAKIGISLFAVPIPNKIEIYPDKFSFIPAPHPVKKGRDEFIRNLENAGVRVIDLVPAFQQARDSCDVFRRFETHWTPRGIEIAARLIAQRIDSAISAHGLARDARCIIRDTVIHEYGDLYLKKRLKWWYKPDTIPVNQVLYPDGTAFEDDKQSKLLILGDSYVDYDRWWKTKLGAQIARFTKVPTRTYFTIMANWNGPCMYQHKPSAFPRNGIVVWAFTSRVLRTAMCNPAKKKE